MNLCRCISLFVVVSTCALGQSRGSLIYGTVKDPTASLVPNAQLTLTQLATNVQRTTSSDASGRYTFNALAAGDYSLKAVSAGFATAEIKQLTLHLEESREADFSLQPEGQATAVNVSAEALQIERTSSTLGQTINAAQVAELPLNGRNFVQLGTLVPGVSQGQGAFFNNRGGSEVSIRGTVSLSAQGMRENANDWLLDGVDNNELTAGAISIQPSIDSIQEFKVLTYNYSAEYGSRGGATVIVNTKSGGNQYHVSLFEYLRNDHLDARNFFDGTRKGKYNQNQAGGSLGGKIKKDKTFFFTDYQKTWIRQGLTILSQVPGLNARKGIFTDSFPGSPAKAIYDPASTRTDPITGLRTRDAFAGGIIPTSRLDPVAVRLLNIYPAPTFTDRLGSNYLSNPVRTFDQDYFNGRIDHTFSEKDTLFGRFSFDNSNQFSPSGLPGEGAGASGNQSNVFYDTKARNFALSETHIFGATKINQLTLGFNRVFNTIRSIGDGSDLSTQIGIPGANLGSYISSGLTNIRMTGGYNRLGERLYSPYQGGSNVFQFADSFNWIHGAHNLKMGYNQRFMQMNTIGITYPAGNFVFDNLFTAAFTAAGALNGATGDPVASLLMGIPTSGTRSQQFAGDVIGRRWKEYRGFLEDTWQVTPNLTLNLGLAYLYVTPTSEVAGRQANFDPSTGTFLIPGKNSDQYAGVRPDRNNWQPRFGFAYTPFGNRKTVVRGGYGIFHDVSANGGSQGLYLNPPFTSELGFTTDNINANRTLQTGFAPTAQPDPLKYTGNVTLMPLDFRMGFIQQWNVNVQRELPAGTVLTVAYAGTHGTGLQGQAFNTNSASTGPGTNPAARRPFPRFNTFNAIVSRGWVTYNSLQVKAEKRMSNGLFFLAAYTWSRSFSNGLQQNVGNFSGIKFWPLYAPGQSDKALADTDLHHSLSISGLYDLPFGKGKRYRANLTGPAQVILGNWQLNSIVRLRSGLPLFMSTNLDQSGAGVGGNRPDRLCSGDISGTAGQTATHWFDTTCFAAPPAGRFGNAARSVLTGPGQVNLDLSIFKDFWVRERFNAQFRTEFFNLTNTAQFANPNAVIGQATTGAILSTINTARQIQFALRLRF